MKNEKSTMKNNVYVINEVLSDYTAGMVVIAAKDWEQCRAYFGEKFGYQYDYLLKQFDRAVENGKYKLFPCSTDQSGVLEYVFGGG